jgi:hypothetical protein
MHALIARDALAMGTVWATFAMRLPCETGELVGETPCSLPGAIGREGVTGRKSVILARQVAIIDQPVHLCRQQVLIGGQESLEIADTDAFAEALSPVPIHDLQDLVAPVKLIERLHWLTGVYLIVRLLNDCTSKL